MGRTLFLFFNPIRISGAISSLPYYLIVLCFFCLTLNSHYSMKKTSSRGTVTGELSGFVSMMSAI